MACVCVSRPHFAGEEPQTAAGGRLRSQEAGESTLSSGWFTPLSSLIINYFNRAENHLKCESLIGVLKERGGRELEEDLSGNIGNGRSEEKWRKWKGEERK